jgi:hypothetical protein
MSDSLNATVIVRWPVSMISANPELLDEEPELPVLEDELEPPRLPAELDPVDPDALDPEPELDDPDDPDDPEDPPEMASPVETLSNEAIVPVAGAYSLVSSSAWRAFWSVASALSMLASANAMLAGDGVVVVEVPDEVPVPELVEPLVDPLPEDPDPLPEDPLAEDPEDPDPLPEDPDPDPLDREPPVPVRDGVVVVVDVVVGVVLVAVVVDVVAVVVSETNSAAVPVIVVLAALDVPPEEDPPEEDPDELPSSRAVSWSSAAVRLSSAWSTVSCSELGSSVASS